MSQRGDHPTQDGGALVTRSDAPPSPGVTVADSQRSTADANSIVGREILGQFRVLSKLGRGGMGAVYLAEQPLMQRHVAIKVLHGDLGEDASSARRFQLEAQAIARLDNPHIVSVYNFGTLDSGELFIAMELLQGRTLRDEMSSVGRFPLARVVELATQLCEGLAEAHRNQVIHRDLKPSNIMLVSRGTGELAKLLDFGIAKLDAGAGTRANEWMGTPRYMAPEQLTNTAVDARADVYALGLILYEMLSGRSPFLADTAMSLVHAQVYENPPSLRDVAPGVVPEAIATVVMSALHKNPALRPASAQAFATALRDAAQSGVAPLTRVPETPTKPKPSAAPIVLASVLGVGLLSVAGFTAWRLTQPESSAVTPPTSPQGTASEPEPNPEPKPDVSPKDTPDFDPQFVAKLPKESRELLKLDVDALMDELDTSLEYLPPSQRGTTRDSYTMQLAAVRDDLQRRTMLIQAILGMRSAAKHFPKDDRSYDELVDDYLAAPGPIPKAMRQETIDTMRKNLQPPEDRDWYVRQWLLGLEKQQNSD